MKKLLISIGAILTLLLIVVVGLVAYVLTFDPNENKDWIAAKFMEQTGRELVLGGNIETTIYPWLGITADNVSIGNAPGFSATPLLQAQHLEGRIKLMPLLNGDYEIDTVRLHGARANLEVLGNGQNNWTMDAESDVSVEESASAREADAGVPNLIIGGVDIQDAALVYDDQFANTHYEVSNLDLRIGELVYGAPLDLRLSLDAASRAPELSVTTTVAGTLLYDLDNGRYDLDPLQLDATLRGPNVPTGSAAINLNAALTVNVEEDTLSLRNLEFDALLTHLSASLEVARASTETPAVTGNVNLSGADLAVIFRILEQEALATRIGALDSSFNVTANFDADMDSGVVNVPTLQANLLGADIDGTLSATRVNTDTPAVTGSLTAAGPDLPTLVEFVGILQGGSAGELTRIGRDLNGVADKSFRVQTDFTADMDAGNVQLPVLTATMLGFSLNGNVDATNINDGGNIDGALTLTGNNLREVLTALGQADLAEVAQSINVDVQLGGSSDNLRISPLNVELVVSGAQIPNSPQTLALNADTTLNLDNDSLSVASFTLSGLGLNLTGNVDATNLQENAAFTGRIEVPAFNARRLLEQLNQPVTTADANVLTNVALSSAFNGTTNSLNVDNLQLTLDQSNLTGSLALSDLEAMSGRFTVNVDAIDADRYLNPTAEDVPAAAEPAPAEPLPVDTLKTLNLQGALNVGQLTISGLKMSDIVVELNAANGKVALNPIRANLYEGSFAGDIGLDVTGAEPVATVNTQINTIALGPLTMDFMDADYLSGTGTIQLALTGRGLDSTTIKSSLTGSGELGVSDGVLSGVDVDAVLRAIETMIRNQRVAPLPQGGETAFEQFAGTLAIDNGVVSSDDLTIKAPGWNVAGTGTLANLTNDTIDFDLIATVDETPASDGQPYDLGGYSLPIACTGALAGPRCLPDAQQILASAITGAVTRRLGDLLQDRLGTGTQQPATTPDANQPAEEEAPAEEDEQEPEEELLNRALDRLLR
jgi:uncharacterized protein involved in outer membrane biogenesis